MTSSEADKFMMQHPEVAVRRYRGGQWEAWKHWNDLGEDMRTQAFSRESVIANYRDMYHPEKPILDNAVFHSPGVMQGWVADSRKYREIIEEYRRYIAFPLTDYSSIGKSNFVFTSKLWKIIEDDCPFHCDKCNQEVKS